MGSPEQPADIIFASRLYEDERVRERNSEGLVFQQPARGTMRGKGNCRKNSISLIEPGRNV